MGNYKGKWFIFARNWKSPIATWRPALKKTTASGDQVAQTAPILLCSTPARFHLRRLLEPFLPKVVVLSPLEIPPMIPVQSLGVVR